MFCGNCGAENANGAKFCKSCGKPLNGGDGQVAKMPLPQSNTNSVNTANTANTASLSGSNVNVNQAADKIKTVPKMVLIGACAVIVALVVIICIVVKAGSTINLNNYLTFESDGYDGYGTLRVSIDWDAIEAKYGDKLSFASQAKKEYGSFINMMTPIDALEDCISVKLEETRELSNGDAVAYTWEVDEEVSTYVKCKLKYKDGVYGISGLTEIGTFDAFSDLEITFSGVEPNGSAEINYSGTEIERYDFSCDKYNGLSNGDIVTVSINKSNVEYYAKNLGKVPETLEKKYTVEGLSGYLSKISDINNEALTAMQQQASDVYHAYTAQSWGEGESLESLTYLGNYLLTTKNKDTWGNQNVLYLVYKAQVRNNYSNDGKTYNQVNDDYWYISFSNVMIDSDGNLTIDVTNYNTPSARFTVDSGVSSGWWSTKSWYYYGYETLDQLYKDVITSNIDVYNHEDNVDEGAAPETVKIEEDTTETGYIFPNSNSEMLTKAELEGLSAADCKIARNEIYARHGRKFKDKELQSYFDSCDWYEGTIDPDDFQESDLSDIEIANKDLIVAYEEEKGYK